MTESIQVALMRGDADPLDYVEIDDVQLARYRLLSACAFLLSDMPDISRHVADRARRALEAAISATVDSELVDDAVRMTMQEEGEPEFLIDAIRLILNAWPEAVEMDCHARPWDRSTSAERIIRAAREKRAREVEERRHEVQEVRRCLRQEI